MSVVFDASYVAFAWPELQYQRGESVTLTPDGGTATTITAVVDRDALTEIGPEAGALYDWPIRVWASQSDWPTVTPKKDTIALKKRPTDSSTVTLRVGEIIQQVGGLWQVTLTK